MPSGKDSGEGSDECLVTSGLGENGEKAGESWPSGRGGRRSAYRKEWVEVERPFFSS